MVLLQVNMPGVSVAPLKSYAPGAVHVEAVTRRLAPEGMEVEAGDVKVAQRRRVFERIQSPQRPASEFRRHLAASTLAKKLLKPFIAEAPKHPPERNIARYTCKASRYRRPRDLRSIEPIHDVERTARGSSAALESRHCDWRVQVARSK